MPGNGGSDGALSGQKLWAGTLHVLEDNSNLLGATEMLGPWFTQVALVMGIGLLIGTTEVAPPTRK